MPMHCTQYACSGLDTELKAMISDTCKEATACVVCQQNITTSMHGPAAHRQPPKRVQQHAMHAQAPTQQAMHV